MDTLTLERRDHLMLIGLNRPAKRNAFNLQMLRELAVAVGEYEADDDLWCALLFAHGDHFTAGLDLGEVGPAVASGATLFPPGAVDPLDLHGERTKPLAMVAQGWCLTIGIELLLAADIRIAAEGTRFGQIEINRGIFPFGGATIRLPQVAGWGNAMRYLLTGDEFDAAEALRIGLVQEVVPHGTQVDRALELAGRVASQAPLAVQASLVGARQAVREGVEPAVADLLPTARRLMASEDAHEGLMSFVERREARFKGR